jgi:hypothetical protein
LKCCCCCRYEGREYEKYLKHSIEFVSSWVMCVRHPRGEFRHSLFGSSERFQPLRCVLVPTPVRLKREEEKTNKTNVVCASMCVFCLSLLERKKLTYFFSVVRRGHLSCYVAQQRPVCYSPFHPAHTVAHVGDTTHTHKQRWPTTSSSSPSPTLAAPR